MNNYKLNLPKTKFSMRANLSIKELKILKKWKKEKLYKKIRTARKGKKIFFLHDGPPYANGDIHIGHAVNKILKDIIIKFYNMSGVDAPYFPSWDCHGLPIEQKIEKKIKKQKNKLSNLEFRKKCKKYVLQQIKNQKKDFIRLGVLANWKKPILTMDYNYQADALTNLAKIIKNGNLYRGFKPVYWCTNCASSLSEAEIEYKKKKSTALTIQFKVKNEKIIKKELNLKKTKKKIYIVVWTTTPWSIPANQAIAVNPAFLYEIISIKNKILIISKNLKISFLNNTKEKKWKILATVQGKKLKKLFFNHPFLPITVPCLLSSHVSQEEGTGAVHISSDHGIEDYEICKKNKINTIKIINKYGIYKKNIHPQLDKIPIKKSEKIIIKLLEKNNSLIIRNTVHHSYPHCWRHHTPIIFRATSQWFIDMEKNKIREKALQAIKKVKWIPQWGKKRMYSMLKKRPDWCISRQRIWGTPIPLFINKKNKKMHPQSIQFIKKIIESIRKHGTKKWWKIKKKKILGKESKKYKKEKDILDVWFDSGSSYSSNSTIKSKKIKNKKKISSLYLEGSDQHRGWFMSSLILSIATNNQAPYKSVLTHGFVVDKKKKKMSKSTGNTIEPKKIIKKLGADILRLWVSFTDYSKEMSISEEILKRLIDYYRRIRNTARFILSNINDFKIHKNKISHKNLIAIDQWAINKTFLVQKYIIKKYKKYNFHAVIKKIIYFCSIDMGSFYFDTIKDRLYTSAANSYNRRSCQTSLFYILNSLVRWISPILSFTSEEIWQNFSKKKSSSIFLKTWFNHLKPFPKKNKLKENLWNFLIKLKNKVNKKIEKNKKIKKIKNSLETEITFYAKKKTRKKLNKLGKELKFFFLAAQVIVKKTSFPKEKTTGDKEIKNLKIKIKKTKKKKCMRCWNYKKKINSYKKYNNICIQCFLKLKNKEKKRKYV